MGPEARRERLAGMAPRLPKIEDSSMAANLNELIQKKDRALPNKLVTSFEIVGEVEPRYIFRELAADRTRGEIPREELLGQASVDF
eukprot:3852392-Heterocapsa_arctica.AAC.1